MDNSILRSIPKVEILLNSDRIREGCGGISQPELKQIIRDYLKELRSSLISGELEHVPDFEYICGSIICKSSEMPKFNLRRVINATGVVLHTNLGRAPIGRSVAEHFADTVSGYCNLEYDLKSGARGQRNSHVEQLLCDLTGAEAAIVVNNNAAAVFLMLNEIAKGHRVAVSRGELVEIGGSFRVPDIMLESGAELVEVGTTNKTKSSDYIKAIEDKDVDALLKVDTSNFKITGFTESVDIERLAEIGKKYRCPVLYDLGSAFLIERESVGIHVGDSVQKSIIAGADVVTFSGDKLMGSVQAGIIAGKKELIDRMRRNSLMRILRPDKMQLAVLEMTLRYYKDPKIAIEKIPVLSMFARSEEELKMSAVSLAARLKGSDDADPLFCFEAVTCRDVTGGGSLPGVTLSGYAVSVTSGTHSPAEMEKFLRLYKTPIIARIADDRLILSVRTLCEGDENDIIEAFTDLRRA